MTQNWPTWFNDYTKGPLLKAIDLKTGQYVGDRLSYVVLPHKYKVGLPNGHTWVYETKKQAKNAALIARALAAMPGREHKHGGHTTIGKYGQQSQLAAALGCNHQRIYNMLRDGSLPRSPERQAKLRSIADSLPDDWFVKCACLAEHEAEHARKE